MKKLLTNNIGYKLLSLAVAILLWMIVVNNENPVTTRTFSGIPVTVTNAEIVTNRGNTYQILEESRAVSVTVTAPRSVMTNLNAKNIKAVADMTNLDPYSGTLIPIDVTVPGYTITEAVANPRNVQVKIEMESTKTFPIVPKSNGTARDGYVIGELTVEPKEVEVSGPESLVDSISQVVAEVNITGLSQDTRQSTDIIFYNEDNAVINSALLKNNLGEDSVTVKISVYHSKEVPVEFDTSAISTAKGYVFEGIDVEPKTVEIVGPIEELDKITELNIPAEALAVSGLEKNEQKTIDISSYYPEWAIQQGESSSVPVIVKINVTKKGTKTIVLATGAISIVNVPKGYKVDYGNTTSIDIVVKGDEKELGKYEPSQGSVSINLIDIKEIGEYEVPVQVVLPKGLKLDKEVKIKINLVKIEEVE